MSEGPTLRTARLVLRRWRESDREPYAALNADPEVTRYFPSALTRAESDAHIDSMEERFEVDGFGLWAVEVPGEFPCIGFIGLARPRFEAHFTPAVEVGWRLAREQWGNGYAPEGAQAALQHGFDTCGLDQIVSFTKEANRNSQRVMQKLGMTSEVADSFDHPSLAPGHPQRRHVLYRITAQRWRDIGRRAGPSPP